MKMNRVLIGSSIEMYEGRESGAVATIVKLGEKWRAVVETLNAPAKFATFDNWQGAKQFISEEVYA